MRKPSPELERTLSRAKLEARLQEELATAAVAQLSEVRRHYEARIAELKDSHAREVSAEKRVIKALAEEVEYLRSQLFGRGVQSTPQPAVVKARPEPDFMPMQNPHYLPEEVEDVMALRDGGHIDDLEYRHIREQLERAIGGEVQIDSF